MKTFLLYLLFLCTTFIAKAQPAEDAQPNPQKEQKIQALYVAYITKQLNLTPEEAQKFWPVHAQYDAELRSLNTSNLPELDKDEAALKIKRKYAANFTKILGANRSNNFNIHDDAFREKIKARLRDLKQQRRQMHDGNKPQRPPVGERKRFN